MTLKQAKKTLKAIGITIRKNDGEYRVNIINGTEATACYTNDIEDAIGTGKAMARSRQSYKLEDSCAGF